MTDNEKTYLKNCVEYVRKRIVPYTYCNKCGTIVLESDIKTYPYQCLCCYEDLYSIETFIDKEEEISDSEFVYLVLKIIQQDIVKRNENMGDESISGLVSLLENISFSDLCYIVDTI